MSQPSPSNLKRSKASIVKEVEAVIAKSVKGKSPIEDEAKTVEDVLDTSVIKEADLEKETEPDMDPPTMSPLILRTTPSTFSKMVTTISPTQKDCVRSFGFGFLLDFNIDSPTPRLGHHVVESFDPENMVTKNDRGDIKIDSLAVNDVLGLPMGGTDISQLKCVAKYEDFHKRWMAQYPRKGKGTQKVYATDISSKIGIGGEVDEYFKMNFVMLFLTSVIFCENGGKCDDSLLQRIGNDTDLLSFDWCGYVLFHLKNSKRFWKPHNAKSFYCGPATFLILLYLDRTEFPFLQVARERPVFRNWNLYLKSREILEVDLGRFGTLGLRPSFDKDYENFRLKLIGFSNEKKLMFEFFNKQRESNPESTTLDFYFSKLNELCPNNSFFYDGERPAFPSNDEADDVVKQQKNSFGQDEQISQPLNVSSPVNDQQNAAVEEKQNSLSQNDELSNDDGENVEETSIYKSLPKRRRISNAGVAVSDGGAHHRYTYERKKPRLKKKTIEEEKKGMEENDVAVSEAAGVEKVKDGSKVSARKGCGHPPKAADESQKDESISIIKQSSTSEVVPKSRRRASE